jgi:uncharacterized protein
MDLLTANPNIGFQVDTDVAIIPSDVACKNSMRFKSVIGSGTVFVVEDPEEKRKGLLSITRQIGNKAEEMDQRAVDGIAVLRVDIETCTYKQSPV